MRQFAARVEHVPWVFRLPKEKSGTDLAMCGNVSLESAKFRLCRFSLQKLAFAHSRGASVWLLAARR